MHNNFLMGVKFGTSWRNFREFSKSPSWREFLKNGLKSNFLEKIVKRFPWKKWRKFYWRFSRKIEGEFWIFYKRSPWKKNWMEEIFKGISLKNWSWIHTRASLARAKFSFKTFFDCAWRSHLLSPTTSTSWNENERSEWLWSEKSEVKWSEWVSVWSDAFFGL